MELEVITPEKKLYEGDVQLVKVPGTKGSFEILHNHAPLISTLAKGTIKIVSEAAEDIYIDIKGGVIEVQQNKVIVLADIH